MACLSISHLVINEHRLTFFLKLLTRCFFILHYDLLFNDVLAQVTNSMIAPTLILIKYVSVIVIRHRLVEWVQADLEIAQNCYSTIWYNSSEATCSCWARPTTNKKIVICESQSSILESSLIFLVWGGLWLLTTTLILERTTSGINSPIFYFITSRVTVFFLAHSDDHQTSIFYLFTVVDATCPNTVLLLLTWQSKRSFRSLIIVVRRVTNTLSFEVNLADLGRASFTIIIQSWAISFSRTLNSRFTDTATYHPNTIINWCHCPSCLDYSLLSLFCPRWFLLILSKTILSLFGYLLAFQIIFVRFWILWEWSKGIIFCFFFLTPTIHFFIISFLVRIVNNVTSSIHFIIFYVFLISLRGWSFHIHESLLKKFSLLWKSFTWHQIFILFDYSCLMNFLERLNPTSVNLMVRLLERVLTFKFRRYCWAGCLLTAFRMLRNFMMIVALNRSFSISSGGFSVLRMISYHISWSVDWWRLWSILTNIEASLCCWSLNYST